jgi:hypothetical protein
MVVLLGACEQRGEVYPRPAAEVRELLGTVEVPLYMFGSSHDTDAVIDSSDPAKIVWKITADEARIMTFTATLQPDGDNRTRVALDLEGARSGRFGDVQARFAKKPEIKTLYLVSMTEAVDSTLDGRPYDITRTYPALIAAGTVNAGAMFNSAGSRAPKNPD